MSDSDDSDDADQQDQALTQQLSNEARAMTEELKRQKDAARPLAQKI
jgi:hypothetical protein